MSNTKYADIADNLFSTMHFGIHYWVEEAEATDNGLTVTTIEGENHFINPAMLIVGMIAWAEDHRGNDSLRSCYLPYRDAALAHNWDYIESAGADVCDMAIQYYLFGKIRYA